MLFLRSNITRATLGASFTIAIMQPFGLANSVARIGPKPVLRGMARWVGDAAWFESSMAWVREKSSFMRLRNKTMNRGINEIAGKVNGQSQTVRVIDAALQFMTTKAQAMVDISTWIGQYEKTLADGVDEASAVALADEAVISSQGGGQGKDSAAARRNHLMLPQFFSYFSTTLNLATAKTAQTDFKDPKAAAGWLADMASLMVIPALGPTALKSLLQGGGGDEQEGLLKFLTKQEASDLISMVVGVREFGGMVSGFSYSGPPVGRIVTDSIKLVQQIQQGDVDDPAVVSAVHVLGDLTGLPVTQVLRTYKGWKEWSQGNVPVTSVLMGPPQKPKLASTS